MIALDANGDLSSPVLLVGWPTKCMDELGILLYIGLYVDNEIAATATGHGEEVIRISGCHLVVELMRQGKSPQKHVKKLLTES
jgi:N4-(beta-N-acetylglucosaminyl)-L-asparaginase